MLSVAISLWKKLKWSLIDLSCMRFCRLFIASVKRLYITKDPRADKSDTKNNGVFLYAALHYSYTPFVLTKFTAFICQVTVLSCSFCSYMMIRCRGCFSASSNWTDNRRLHTSTWHESPGL
jgi:hypothetical protein